MQAPHKARRIDLDQGRVDFGSAHASGGVSHVESFLLVSRFHTSSVPPLEATRLTRFGDSAIPNELSPTHPESARPSAILAIMPRPSRIEEAREKLRAYYAAHGGMPTIQAFAELMGYASASSAHDVTNALVAQGFLTKDGRGGRLLPGPKFGAKRGRALNVPEELLEALPKGVALEVLRVPKRSSLAAGGVLAGDCLVLAPADRTDLSGTLLLARRRQRVLAEAPSKGWGVAAVVVAQFRTYKP